MNLVGLDSYAQNDLEGFGTASQGEMSDLNKALSAGSVSGGSTVDSLTASGAPLKVESLEKSLRIYTFKENDIKFYRATKTLPAYNTVEEYNRLESYGSDVGGFMAEGALPTTEDSIYSRRTQIVKFMGVTREVTHPMTLVKTNVGDQIERETKNGTNWILRKMNKSMFTGDANTVPLSFNGIFQQSREGYSTDLTYSDSEYVIDLRGSTLDEETLEESCRIVSDNFGSVDTLFCPPIALSNFVKTFYGNLRQLSPVNADSVVGRRITKFQSQYGEIDLNFDKFLNKRASKTSTSAADANGANGTFTMDATNPILSPADATSKFAAADAGDYFYALTAFNAGGETALDDVSSTIHTVASGDRVDLKFTYADGSRVATGFRVYRSNEGAASVAAATFYPIFDVSVAEHAAGYNGASALQIGDLSIFMPNTDRAIMYENDEEIFAVKQLAPLMKMNLAVVQTSMRFMVLLYSTPILYQPKKVINIINIGLL